LGGEVGFKQQKVSVHSVCFVFVSAVVKVFLLVLKQFYDFCRFVAFYLKDVNSGFCLFAF